MFEKGCSFPANFPPSFVLQLCQFCISSIVQRGIQILEIEDKSIIVNNTPYQIYFKPQLSVMKPQLKEEVKY